MNAHTATATCLVVSPRRWWGCRTRAGWQSARGGGWTGHTGPGQDARRRRGPAEVVGAAHLEAVEAVARGGRLGLKVPEPSLARRHGLKAGLVFAAPQAQAAVCTLVPDRVAVSDVEVEGGADRCGAGLRIGEHSAAAVHMGHRRLGVDVDVHPCRGDGVAAGVDEVDRQEVGVGELLGVGPSASDGWKLPHTAAQPGPGRPQAWVTNTLSKWHCSAVPPSAWMPIAGRVSVVRSASASVTPTGPRDWAGYVRAPGGASGAMLLERKAHRTGV